MMTFFVRLVATLAIMSIALAFAIIFGGCTSPADRAERRDAAVALQLIHGMEEPATHTP